MAKLKLSEGGFTLIPEGVTVFKVTEVEHKDDFGKIDCTLQTKDGQTHHEKFSYINNQGEINEGALKAFSYFARNCMNNFDIEEIDPEDLVGCYIKATVKHEKYTAKSGKHEGKELTAVRLNDYSVALGFEGAKAPVGNPEPIDDEDDDDDLMDFLDED